MRKIILGMFLLLLGGMVFPGSLTTAQSENVLTVLFSPGREPANLDPALAYTSSEMGVLYNIYDRLVTYEGEDSKTLHPSLAESWEISPDGMVYTFHLRHDVLFSNGDPVTSEAVQYSLTRVLKLNGDPAWMYKQAIGADSVKIIDDFTVKISLKKPYGPFLATLAFSAASIVNPEVVKEKGDVWLQSHSAGSGPFTIEEWKKGESLTLSSNPNYFLGKPGYDKIVFRYIDDFDEMKRLLDSGESIMIPDFPIDEVNSVRGDNNIAVDTNLEACIDTMTMNGRLSYFQDKKVRQALSYAFPYEEVLKEYYNGYGIQAPGPVPKGVFGSDPTIAWYRTDLEKARKALSESGFRTGFSFDSYYSQGNNYRQGVLEMFKKNLGVIGIEMRINEVTSDQYNSMRQEGKLPLDFLGWCIDYADADDFIYPFCHSQGYYYQRSRYKNLELDSLIEKSANEPDQKKRQKLYSDILRMIKEEAPMIWTVQPSNVVAFTRNIKGYEYNIALRISYKSLWDENVYIDKANSLLEEAKSLLSSKDFNSAIAKLNEVLPLFEQIGNKEKIQEVQNLIEQCNEALKTSGNIETLTQEASSLFDQAKTAFDATDYQKAKDLFSQAKDKYTQIGDSEKKTQCEDYIRQCEEKLAQTQAPPEEKKTGIGAIAILIGISMAIGYLKRKRKY